MNDTMEVLKSIEKRLAAIEVIVSKPILSEAICKGSYSCSEVADLTGVYGIKTYRPFTVRLACKDGRIAEAEKNESGAWLVPRQAVMRLLEHGIPPERRNGYSQR